MEQIQQHEWEHKYKWFWKCPHCECVKVVPNLGSTTYHPRFGDYTSTTEEPACITRKITEDENSN